MSAVGKTTARDALLAQQFVRLADTLVDDYDVVELLEQLVETCVDLLGVTAAGLLLMDAHGDLQLVAASSEESRIVEILQLENEQGPCLEAVRTGRQVSVTGAEQIRSRWPMFAETVDTAGFRAVHACPLRLRTQTIGALNLFSAEARAMSPEDLQIAQALADVATIGILQERVIDRAALVAEQLQTALETRVVIEQAKGVLAESAHIDMQEAFVALRAYARATRSKLGVVARQVITRELAPDVVLGPER